MEPIVIPLTLNKVDQQFVVQAAKRAGTDLETFIICAAVRRAIKEEEMYEHEQMVRRMA